MAESDLSLDFFRTLRENVKRFPDRPAFETLGDSDREVYTYRRVVLEIDRLSRYLCEHGIGPGGKVGLAFENHPRWGVAFLAILSAGAVAVPLDIQHSPETLSGLIHHAECRFLFSSRRFLPVLEEILASLGRELPVLILGETEGKFPQWSDLLGDAQEDGEDAAVPLVDRPIDEPHLVLYTSGTTGDPKGVVLTGRNMFSNVAEALRLIRITEEDHFLGVLPLYHILALMVNFIVPLYAGAKTSFLDVLDAQRILKAFREEGITIFVCVPQFYYLLHGRILSEVGKQPRTRRILFRLLMRLSRFAWFRLQWRIGRRLFRPVHEPFGDRFRIFGVGGARFAPEVAQQLTDLGFVVVQAYGMTETAALATLAPPVPRGIGSAGTAMAHDEIRIDRPDERGIGEVLIRGENVMPGYYRNPQATSETIRDGWLHTGDLGYLDPHGFLYITGRAKEVIVLSSGKNIYPEEIEHFYQSNCSLIQEICVMGLAEEGGSERLHAVIVPDFEQLRQEKVVHAHNMIRYLTETLSQQLPPHKRIRSLEIWRDPLPRTPTRKIKRFEVEELVRSGERLINGAQEPRSEAWEPDDPVDQRLVELIHRVKRDAAVFPQANLELDVGLDSLERVEFLSSVQERFRIHLGEEEASEVLTFEDVSELVRGRVEAGSESEGQHKSWGEILSEPLARDHAEELKRHLKRRPVPEALFVAATWIVRLVCRLLFRLRAEGLDRLPQDYPFLLCPNHASYLDSFLVTCLLPPRVARRFCALAYEDYVGGYFTGFLSRMFKVIPVNPDAKLRRSLRLAAQGLRSGLVLEVFPEGERSIDGSLKTFRKGPAILATCLQIPIVPVGIIGTHEVWPRGSSKIRFRPVTVRFGEPLEPREDESAEEFNDRLRSAVGQLLS